MRYRDMQDRLFAMSVVCPVTGCWLWLGQTQRGYGRLAVRVVGKANPVKRRAHRVSYETFIGPIPEGHELDHECETPGCIHPNHVTPLRPEVNNALRWSRAR